MEDMETCVYACVQHGFDICVNKLQLSALLLIKHLRRVGDEKQTRRQK